MHAHTDLNFAKRLRKLTQRHQGNSWAHGVEVLYDIDLFCSSD